MRFTSSLRKASSRSARSGAGAGGGPSTDMGNVSHVVPSIHPMFAIPTEAGNHTPGFTAAAATAEAHQAMRTAATALAMTALDLYLRPDLLEAARADFEETHALGQEETVNAPALAGLERGQFLQLVAGQGQWAVSFGETEVGT